MGGGMGRGGSGHEGRPSATSEADRKRMQELISELNSPSPALTITHAETRLAITDSLGRTRTFHINGQKEKHQLDAGLVETTTKWDGAGVATTYELGSGRKVRYVYSLMPATRQLLLQVTVEGVRGTSGGGRAPVRQVYEPAFPPP